MRTRWLFTVFIWGVLTFATRAADPIAIFDQANRLYEQGKFVDAANAYQQLAFSGQTSATVYYNLGNAWFKAGQLGRAVAAYRRAEALAPRDPNIRFNLNFARKQVTGSDAPLPAPWQRWLSRLTVNEWTVFASAAVWILFSLLILREWRSPLRRSFRPYVITASAATILFVGVAGLAFYERARTHEAVVVTPQAIVRYGPIEDSRVHYQLRDGSEVVVLDQKQLSQTESWLQVRDGSQRIGWLKRDQVVVL
jgi:tetratricopeptide (TPR) repeat protein